MIASTGSRGGRRSGSRAVPGAGHPDPNPGGAPGDGGGVARPSILRDRPRRAPRTRTRPPFCPSCQGDHNTR
ncbi:MAG: hypothetical protein AVDCRST_MAG59-3427 [uncultured Thermomicrobiales bacterium]|uniref:Uncharacterized protein n=1 Tax=uncultured Thermomicrobiales bacterium TaxID=1645740 RepID=A0A6J4VC58_9BACT|nr:MAG: hypothetical protein AVDCRST_MAG59-3427 [uncultured Thermomicrobiales bacterium]